MKSAPNALKRLIEGNERFVRGEPHNFVNQDQRAALVKDQTPFAVILGCSDSRVPHEIVFYQGLGDLFVIRVAGHVAGPLELESIRFATDVLGTNLVVVLGHTECGAVKAAIQNFDDPTSGFESLIEKIRPNIAQARQLSDTTKSVTAHTLATVDEVRDASRGFDNPPTVVGAVYDLETGAVDFLET